MKEKPIDEAERFGEKDGHVISSESISQLFGSFLADRIPFEIECGQCLREKTEAINEQD